MALARWQQFIADDNGNVVPEATVEVRDSSDNSLASIFSDRAGLNAKSNPFTADTDGLAAFHAAGGSYTIIITATGLSRVLTYVPIGLAQESDLVEFFENDNEQETTLEDADKFPFFDNSASNARKLITKANMAAQLITPVGGAPLLFRPNQAWFPPSGGATLGVYDSFDVISYADSEDQEARWVGAMPNNYDADVGLTLDILILASSGANPFNIDAKISDLVGYDSDGNGGTWVSQDGVIASISVINKVSFTFSNSELGPAVRSPRMPFLFSLRRDSSDTSTQTLYVLSATLYSTPPS